MTKEQKLRFKQKDLQKEAPVPTDAVLELLYNYIGTKRNTYQDYVNETNNDKVFTALHHITQA